MGKGKKIENEIHTTNNVQALRRNFKTINCILENFLYVIKHFSGFFRVNIQKLQITLPNISKVYWSIVFLDNFCYIQLKRAYVG